MGEEPLAKGGEWGEPSLLEWREREGRWRRSLHETSMSEQVSNVLSSPLVASSQETKGVDLPVMIIAQPPSAQTRYSSICFAFGGPPPHLDRHSAIAT
jgi:hypothetical protein